MIELDATEVLETQPARHDSGPRTGILLLHGLTGTPTEMRPVERFLAKKGIRVSVPMLAGHGAGHRELLASTWQDWLSGARDAYLALKAECDQVFVGGLSMGSLVSTLLAAEPELEVTGLVMISTTLFYDGVSIPITRHLLPLAHWFPFLGNYFSWMERPPYGLKDERLQRVITKAIDDAKKGNGTKYGLFETHVGAVRQMRLLVKEVRRKASTVECPVLIIHSLEDTIATAANAYEMHQILGSREKILRLQLGGDHVLTVDLCKDDIANAVGQFVGFQSCLGGKEERAKCLSANIGHASGHPIIPGCSG